MSFFVACTPSLHSRGRGSAIPPLPNFPLHPAVLTLCSSRGVERWNSASAAYPELPRPPCAPALAPLSRAHRGVLKAAASLKPHPAPSPSGLHPSNAAAAAGAPVIPEKWRSLLLMRAGSAARLRWGASPGAPAQPPPLSWELGAGLDLIIYPACLGGCDCALEREYKGKNALKSFLCVRAGVARPRRCVCVEPRSN